MLHKIPKIGFDMMREHQVDAYNFENRFMIFDNLSETEQYCELVQPTDFPVNFNDITVVILCLKGSISIKFNIELSCTTLRENQLCMILPNHIFQVTEVSEDFRAFFLVMEKDFFNFQLDVNKTTKLNYHLEDRYFFSLNDKETQECRTIYEAIRSKIKDKDSAYCKEIIQCYCQVMVYNIYNLMINASESADIDKKKRTDYLYERFMKLLEQHHKEEYTVAFYADRLCLTPKYLSAVIHSITGKHATEWIQEYRVLVAKIALRSTDSNLKDIAEMLNFSTPSHFGRFFKLHTSCTPCEYRRLSL
jgi:AraC-type DNA-binding domain-containing proteins